MPAPDPKTSAGSETVVEKQDGDPVTPPVLLTPKERRDVVAAYNHLLAPLGGFCR